MDWLEGGGWEFYDILQDDNGEWCGIYEDENGEIQDGHCAWF